MDTGQLCPYEDCQEWVTLTKDWGWCDCPHCGKKFWYKNSPRDYTEYRCFLPDKRVKDE